MLAGFEFSSTNGPKAYLHEVDYDPRKIWKNCLNTEVELTCVVGELDPNDRINRAHILAAAGAPLDIHIVKSAGQLIHLSHWQEVANLVLAKISQLNTDHNSPAEASR